MKGLILIRLRIGIRTRPIYYGSCNTLKTILQVSQDARCILEKFGHTFGDPQSVPFEDLSVGVSRLCDPWPELDGKSVMEVICDVFQTYRYLIRESEIYFQQVLLYLGFENEYYFLIYLLLDYFFLYLNKIMLCFVNIINFPSYRSFPGMYSLWVFQLHRVDFKKLYLELMSVLIFKAKKSISTETQNKKKLS